MIQRMRKICPKKCSVPPLLIQSLQDYHAQNLARDEQDSNKFHVKLKGNLN